LRVYWRTLMQPSNEWCLHPLTREVLGDLEITRAQQRKHGTFYACLQTAAAAENWLTPELGATLETELAALYRSHHRDAGRQIAAAGSWCRYTLV